MLTHAPSTIYREFLAELKRIFGKEILSSDRELIFKTYIYDKVPDCMGRDLKGGSAVSLTDSLPEWLTLKPVLEHTLEMLKIMRSVEGWPEFERLANKTLVNDKPLNVLTIGCL